MKNYFKDLVDRADTRFSKETMDMKMTDWIEENTTLKGKPFTFKNHKFQEQIVNDMHTNMDVIKPSQVGLTEAQIRKVLGSSVRMQGTSTIYTLPTEEMYKRVSKGRIKPIVDKDEVFNTEYDKANKAVRSVDMMQFGQSFLYITPTIETAATSIPADIVINDEQDLCDQKMITLFNSRLQGSSLGISQRFSTPTFPSFAIDAGYQSTDQHEYAAKCGCCGHFNFPEFNDNFIHLPGRPDVEKLQDITVDYQDMLTLQDSYVKCERCHERLDLFNDDLRQWVAKYPNRSESARGYKITPFVLPKLDPMYIMTQLWKYQKDDYLRGFYNTVLGIPYSDGTIQIPEEDILECMTGQLGVPHVGKEIPVFVGIDMGNTCHVVLGAMLGNDKEKLHLFKFYTCSADDIETEVENLQKEYNIVAGCVDRHPFGPTSKSIFKKSKFKILPVEYRGLKNLNLVNDEFGELSHAQVSRTWFLDNFAAKIRKHVLKISGYGGQKQIYIRHLRNMVRDEEPETPAVWKKLDNEDHYFHASAFCVLAPLVRELDEFKSKADNRTVIMSASPKVIDTTPGLIGMSSSGLVSKKSHIIRTSVIK